MRSRSFASSASVLLFIISPAQIRLISRRTPSHEVHKVSLVDRSLVLGEPCVGIGEEIWIANEPEFLPAFGEGPVEENLGLDEYLGIRSLELRRGGRKSRFGQSVVSRGGGVPDVVIDPLDREAWQVLPDRPPAHVADSAAASPVADRLLTIGPQHRCELGVGLPIAREGVVEPGLERVERPEGRGINHLFMVRGAAGRLQ